LNLDQQSLQVGQFHGLERVAVARGLAQPLSPHRPLAAAITARRDGERRGDRPAGLKITVARGALARDFSAGEEIDP
jgi:hypothetical protein